MAHCKPKCDPSNEPLSSSLNNFILSFFGSVTKSCVNGQVVWTLPCDLDAGIPGFPRISGEGVACYLLRIFQSGFVASQITLNSFIQPAVGGSVDVTINNPTTYTVGQTVVIPGAGTYTVTGVGSNSVTLTLEPGSPIPPGGVVPTGSSVVVVNSTSGFTGTIDVVTDVSFASPSFIQTKVTKTYVNGILWSVSAPFNSIVFTASACP